MNTVSLGAVVASAHQSLLPLSIVGFTLRREMRVEVTVHSVLRNHSMAKSTFIRTAALRRRNLCHHVNCITQLRAPERLQSRMNQRKQYIIHALNNPYTHSIKACWPTWFPSWSISWNTSTWPLPTQPSAQILSKIKSYAQMFNYPPTVCSPTKQSLACYICSYWCNTGKESLYGKTGPMFRSYCMSFRFFY